MSSAASLTELLTGIADSIRSKDGTTDKIPATELATKIGSITIFDESISPVTITNNLSNVIEFHSYNSSGGFVKTEIQAGSTATHNLNNGILVFSLPSTAKITTSGATTDLTNTSLAAGAYCIGFTGELSVTVSS